MWFPFRRVLSMFPVLLAVSVISFTLLRLAPGDPAEIAAGVDSTQERVEVLRAEMNLDKSLIEQYVTWLGGLLRGDLGQSYTSSRPVTEILLKHLGPTLQIASLALLLIVVFGVGLGVVSAVHHNGVVDHLVRLISLAGISVPNFVFAIFFVLIFGWWLSGILPYQGWVGMLDDPLRSLQHSLLPAIALAAPQIGLVARLTRSNMLEVMSLDYITAGRAMGISERTLQWKDALRNALLPVLTVLGLVFGLLLGGSVVVETIFGIHGIGQLLVESFSQRDYPVTIGVMLLAATAFVLINFVVDVLYGVVNPKIRLNK